MIEMQGFVFVFFFRKIHSKGEGEGHQLSLRNLWNWFWALFMEKVTLPSLIETEASSSASLMR